MQQITKYTVNVIKNDGMKSIYHVVALSAGGAEETVLREVYAARYADAKKGWADNVTSYDLISRGAAMAAVDLAIT